MVDQANVLSAPVKAELTAKLADLEARSTIQLVVATVSNLEGQEIEPYANDLFRFWKLGQAKKDNGALLLVAPKEHKVRIEVGYGLEGTLTDAISKIIIVNAIAPRFKASDFDGGVKRGVDDIITTLTTDASEWQSKPEFQTAKRQTQSSPGEGFIIFIVVVLIILFASRFSGGARRGIVVWGPSGGGWREGGGSSGGGDSFSGGGGSSGGGGASGSW